jgi:hypothetical protein
MATLGVTESIERKTTAAVTTRFGAAAVLAALPFAITGVARTVLTVALLAGVAVVFVHTPVIARRDPVTPVDVGGRGDDGRRRNRPTGRHADHPIVRAAVSGSGGSSTALPTRRVPASDSPSTAIERHTSGASGAETASYRC